MIRKLLDNIEIKLVCLLLAVIMWLYANNRTDIIGRARAFITRSEQGAITLLDVPVELIGTKDSAKYSAEPNRISIEIICSSGTNIDIPNVKAKVKLSNKISDKIPLKEDNVELPNGMKFVRSEPTEISIRQK
ncbi:TPA: hypothetical protein ENX78_14770 [Candidatus Poribacteria bacterium]|nr:hypothetical protein [Candidatus Poribacteria bacterium]